MRSGSYVPQDGGYQAFFPAPLPPDPPIRLRYALQERLGEVGMEVRRLRKTTGDTPLSASLAAMLTRRESVLSCQLEGTLATLDDLLWCEFTGGCSDVHAKTVHDYYSGASEAFRSRTFAPYQALILDLHARVMAHAGECDVAGAFRSKQVFIAEPEGSGVTDAVFVPPPAHAISPAIANLAKWLADKSLYSPLAAAVAHAQFLTIHPFSDGNGRVGRILITCVLLDRGLIPMPYIHLSAFFRRTRADYYDRLMAVRNDGDWEAWCEYFAEGLAICAQEASQRSEQMSQLIDESVEAVRAVTTEDEGRRFLYALTAQPLAESTELAARVGWPQRRVETSLAALSDAGLLNQVAGSASRHRIVFEKYVALFRDREPASRLPQETEVLQND